MMKTQNTMNTKMNKAMKKYIFTIALLFALTSLACAQGFGSTSSDYMNTGSTLSSTVYAVGATSIDPASAAPNRGRTMIMDDDDDDEESTWGDVGDFTPIGTPWALLAFAALAAGWVYLRRRKQTL